MINLGKNVWNKRGLFIKNYYWSPNGSIAQYETNIIEDSAWYSVWNFVWEPIFARTLIYSELIRIAREPLTMNAKFQVDSFKANLFSRFFTRWFSRFPKWPI